MPLRTLPQRLSPLTHLVLDIQDVTYVTGAVATTDVPEACQNHQPIAGRPLVEMMKSFFACTYATALVGLESMLHSAITSFDRKVVLMRSLGVYTIIKLVYA